mmetsp:Transcript_22178/g.54834  ORF Transcript_22178/g.54834 Transcript_22178/m.54834 type:complete len:94 (+) Transcript_22178:1635-1916(+)
MKRGYFLWYHHLLVPQSMMIEVEKNDEKLCRGSVHNPLKNQSICLENLILNGTSYHTKLHEYCTFLQTRRGRAKNGGGSEIFSSGSGSRYTSL